VRFASLAYDAVLLVPVLFIAGYLFVALTHDARTPFMKLAFQLWLLAVLAGYFSYCWARSGQTLAMKTWGVRVARQDGMPLSLAHALTRFLLAVWSVGLLGVGLVWTFVDRDRQFLHDRLAGTRIFEA
jgi:uncharacterized RDD family membrane protein YckC